MKHASSASPFTHTDHLRGQWIISKNFRVLYKTRSWIHLVPTAVPWIHRPSLNEASTYRPAVIKLIIFQTRVCGSASDWIVSPPLPPCCDKAHFLTSPLSLPPPLICRLFIRPLIHSSPAICSALPHTPLSSLCIHALAFHPPAFVFLILPPSPSLFFPHKWQLLRWSSGRVSLSRRSSLLRIVDTSAPRSCSDLPASVRADERPICFVSSPDGHLLRLPFLTCRFIGLYTCWNAAADGSETTKWRRQKGYLEGEEITQ